MKIKVCGQLKREKELNMATPEIPKSSLEFGIFSFWLLLVFCSCKQAQSGVASEATDISISLSCFKEQVGVSEPNQVLPKLIPVTEVNYLDPIILKLTITNKSAKEISVLYPDLIYKTAILSFRDKASGQQIPDQRRWIGGRGSDYITIQPGRSYEALLYIEQLYPNGISSGTYEISIQYIPNYNRPILQTNSILLLVAPQSEDEKKHVANFIKLAEKWGSTEDKELFLKENPVGRFRNRIYLRIAGEQIQLKKYEDASKILDDIIFSKTSTTYQKGEAWYQKARLLRDHLGKLDEAIECLEKSPLRSAKNEVERWKKEKDSQKK